MGIVSLPTHLPLGDYVGVTDEQGVDGVGVVGQPLIAQPVADLLRSIIAARVRLNVLHRLGGDLEAL